MSAHGDGVWMCCVHHKGGYAYADYGGKRARDDETLWATAVREAREEGGWDFFAAHAARAVANRVAFKRPRLSLYVVFLVETICSPLKTRDAAVAHHALVGDAIFRETLHDRLKYATGFRGVLARVLRTPPAERNSHGMPP